MDARQLGLKYIANVTYGYTAATFSGRMPAVEIADSIVQSGRETLEKVQLESQKFLSYMLTVFRLSTLSMAIGNGEQRYIRTLLESRLLNSL